MMNAKVVVVAVVVLVVVGKATKCACNLARSWSPPISKELGPALHHSQPSTREKRVQDKVLSVRTYQIFAR